jgi:hypothetical protein
LLLRDLGEAERTGQLAPIDLRAHYALDWALAAWPPSSARLILALELRSARPGARWTNPVVPQLRVTVHQSLPEESDHERARCP